MERASRSPIELQWRGPVRLVVSEGGLEFDRSSAASEAGEFGSVYSMIGDHPVHGSRALLYLGLHAGPEIETRWKQHDWLRDEWAWRLEMFYAPVPVQAIEVGLEAVEGLLIKSHQPIYNTMKKGRFASEAGPFTIWNHGACPRLLPEVSSDHPWNQ